MDSSWACPCWASDQIADWSEAESIQWAWTAFIWRYDNVTTEYLKLAWYPTRELIFSIVSDPKHHRYGQHLSRAQINELVKPCDETLAQVHDWLLDNDIDEDQFEYNTAKDWIKVTLPVTSIESLLDTKYSVFQHEDGSRLIRTSQW